MMTDLSIVLLLMDYVNPCPYLESMKVTNYEANRAERKTVQVRY